MEEAGAVGTAIPLGCELSLMLSITNEDSIRISRQQPPEVSSSGYETR